MELCSMFVAAWMGGEFGGYMYTHGWIPLLSTWNYQNVVNQLCESCSVLSDSLQPHRLYSPWNSPGQNTGVGSLSLLQGIFPTQGWNPGLPHCRQVLYQLSHKESPRTLGWASYPFSEDLSDPGIKPGSPALQADTLPSKLSEKPIIGYTPI